MHRGAGDLRHRRLGARVRRADPRGRVEHQLVDLAPDVARPEVVAGRGVDRRHRHARRRQRRRQRQVQRQPLQRVVRRADAVEIAAEPAGPEPRIERADLVEVARHEVRLVGMLVADGRHHRHLALGVQRGDRRRRRMPAQPRVLAERRARARRQRELRPQPPVRRVLGRREERHRVDPALQEHLDDHPLARRRLRDRLLGGERREPPGAVDRQCEPRRAQQERATREPGAGGGRHAGLDRPAGRRRRWRAAARCGRSRGSGGPSARVQVGRGRDQHP